MRVDFSDWGSSRGDCLVIFKRVNRVIGRADGVNAEFLENSFDRKLFGLEKRVCLFPDCGRRFYGERLVDSEISLKLKVRPVVERISDKMLDCLRPFEEFFVVRLVAGDVVLGHAVSAHLSPFVVVAAKPDFREVLEFLVFGNLSRNQVAVIVPKRLVFARLKQLLSGFRLKKKVFVHEFFHT